ncbi:DNA topoisomerase 2-binding 1-A isoform X1 [Micractinium conductrix]|uniref:DNA topoisomerase 2-binding 1-A isoform X1 n=1 Tax=Micractinium conductrix TaxID=554055 RepID=A0A2P6V0K7_9CHLO|nr:DNA topoisomerase 2-binding 1-A isoform X1 [Micractinium conductrix]|eukprot:PSC67627.1 DNA topoisomerase 2-binding 1-A isoform X1 [Micractinium conductrix]
MAAALANMLDGYWVLVTAVRPQEREPLMRQVAECGGEVVAAVRASDPPHVVLTRSVRSPKYRGLMRVAPHTPVVTPDWLTASLQAGRVLPYDGYRVGPFQGLTVRLSGLSAARKAALAGLVAGGGGVHSPALDKKCTHLVTVSTQSEKYKFAKREGITVVTTQWVEDSTQAGWCQEEAPYAVCDEVDGEGAGQSGATAVAATSAFADQSLGAVPAAARRFAPAGQLEEATSLGAPLAPSASEGVAPTVLGGEAGLPPRAPARLQRVASNLGGAAAPEGLAAEAATSASGDGYAPAEERRAGRGSGQPPRNSSRLRPQGQQQLPDVRGSGEPTAAADAAAPAAMAMHPAAIARRAEAEAVAALEAQLEGDDSAPTYLDAVRLRLLGCGVDEHREALGLVREGAAKRFNDWTDDLHHIVIGCDLSAAEAAEAHDFLSTHRACQPVTLEWLRQSVAARRRLRPDGFLVPTSLLAQYRRRPPALEALAAADRTTSSASLAEPALSAGGEPHRAQPAAAAPPGPLDGCYFTLAALRGEEQALARRLVQENGGRLFTETTLQLVDKSRAFALCPHSLVSHEITQLRNGCPDFKLVDDKQRFTLYWLECSLLAGAPLPASRGAPLYQPLPYPLPVPSMQGVVVCTSGYDNAVRAAIGRTVETLGGAYTPDSMTRRNTHLILPEAKGKKYEFCVSFGVIPVTADWLVDTVTMGRRQAEDQYWPRAQPGAPPLPLPAPHLLAAAPEHSRGGSTGAASQLMTTQMVTTTQAALPGNAAAAAAVAAAAAAPRPQLVLPPPPAQPLVGSTGPGGRRRSLRERLGANQQRAAAAAAAAQPLVPPGDAAPANDENNSQGTNGGTAAAAAGGAGVVGKVHEADLLQLGGQPMTTSFGATAAPAAQQAQQVQRSALDDMMASLDEGLKTQLQLQEPALLQQEPALQQAAAVPVGEQRPSGQVQAPPAQPSLFNELFGSEPAAGAAAAPGGNAAPGEELCVARGSGRAQSHSSRLGPQPAAAPEAAPAAVAAAAVPEAAPAPPSGGRKRTPTDERRAGRPKEKPHRSSSRLRPQAQQQQLDDAAAEAAAAQAPPLPSSGIAAALAAAEASGLGSEPQGDDVARALDKLGDLLGGLPAEAPPGCGSQLDALMPPPAARGRAGAKRGALQPEESTLSNGSGGSRGHAAKRPTLADDGTTGGGGGGSGGAGSGRGQRRSGRGRGDLPGLLPHLEMSQQVGYADSLIDSQMDGGELPAARQTRASRGQLTRALVQAAAGVRSGARRGAAAGRSADPLADLMT